MIDRQLALAATALTETLSVAESSGSLADAVRDLTPILAIGLVHAQRAMVLYLLDHESDWPWSEPDGVSCCHC